MGIAQSASALRVAAIGRKTRRFALIVIIKRSHERTSTSRLQRKERGFVMKVFCATIFYMEKTLMKRRGRPRKSELKTPTSFRLSRTAHGLLTALADESGLSHVSVLELALRDMAKRRGVKASDKVGALYWNSLSQSGELTASTRFQEDLHEYSAAELAAMEAGEFERPLS